MWFMDGDFVLVVHFNWMGFLWKKCGNSLTLVFYPWSCLINSSLAFFIKFIVSLLLYLSDE